jgi:ADP-ribose pyrophosphatase YjhB (NUDIX family)
MQTFTGQRRRRLAARAVVIDPRGATFLFRYDDAEVGRHWSPPGGGLERGETYIQAANRELREETGWSDLEIGARLYSWEHNYTRLGLPVAQYEEVFAVFGPHRAPVGDLRASHRADEILEWRWWQPTELRSTTEAMWPRTLVTLVEAAVSDV